MMLKCLLQAAIFVWWKQVETVGAFSLPCQGIQRCYITSSSSSTAIGARAFQKKKGPRASRAQIDLNRAIGSAKSTDEVLSVLASVPNGLSKYAGGNSLNVVNFSTSFHRLAKYTAREKKGIEMVKKDVAFAALVACFGEALSGPKGHEMTENTTRQMANTMWALAKLECLTPNMSICAVSEEASVAHLQITAARLRSLLQQSSIEATGGVVVASPELILSMVATCDVIMDLLAICFLNSDDHHPQGISNTLWSMATSRRWYYVIVEPLVDCFINLSGSSTMLPQHWSNTIWAVATLGVESSGESIVNAMANMALSSERTDSFFSSFNGQDLSITAWSTSTLLAIVYQRTSDDKLGDGKPFLYLLGTLKDFIVKRLDGIQGKAWFNSQDISNILWAFSTASISCQDLFDSAANYCLLSRFLFRKMNSQDIGNIIWAFGMQAKLSEESTTAGPDGSSKPSSSREFELVLGLIDVALDKNSMFRRMDTLDISQMCWGMAAMRIRYDPFLERTIQELRRHFECNNLKVDAQLHSNILWACATLNYSSDVDLAAFSQSMSSWDRHGLSNVAWSLAVSRRYNATLTKRIFDAFFRLIPTEDQQALDMDSQVKLQKQQLLCLDIALALESPSDHRVVFNSDKLRRDRERLYQLEAGSVMNMRNSRMQQEVSRSFERIGFDHEEEYVIFMADIANEAGLDIPALDRQVFSIDLACPKSRISIEVDGPFHFVQMIDVVVDGKEKKVSTRLIPDGSTALKKRLLERLGWRVINVPYWEWNKMTSKAAKDNYCLSLLKTVGYKAKKRAYK